MRKTGVSISAFVLAAGAGLFCAAASAQAQTGPVGYWKGDDGASPVTALDSAGTNNGTYQGGATTIPIPAPVTFPDTACMSFNGTTAVVSAPTFPWPTGGPITVAFWNFVPTAFNKSAFSIGNLDTPNRAQAHAPWGDGNIYWDYGNLGTTGRVSASYAAKLNKWTHVALVSEGTGGAFMAIYLDGVLAVSAASSDGPTTAMTGVQIGAWTGGGFYHSGQIDDFRIYNRVLTAVQIQQLAAGKTEPVTPTGLAAFAATGQVTLTWDAMPGAVSYNLKRGTTSGGPYPTVVSVSGTSYIDTTVTNGTTYYYVVSSVNGIGESADSFQVAATPPLVPRTTTFGAGKANRCGCASIPGPGWGPLGWGLMSLLAVLAWGLRR
jgi:hypothetical protein